MTTTDQARVLAEATLAGRPDYNYDPDAERMLARAVLALTDELERAHADATALRESLAFASNQIASVARSSRLHPEIQRLLRVSVAGINERLESTTAGAELLAELARLRAALLAQEDAENKHANCDDCEGEGDWAECGPCSELFGNAIDMRHMALRAAKVAT